MADMYDCGRGQFKRWAAGSAHARRFFGEFDPSRSAADQWRISDFERAIGPLSPAFARGWESARAEHGQPSEVNK